MAEVDLEARVVRLENALDAPVHLDKLKSEVAAIQDPVLAKALFYLERYSTMLESGQRMSVKDQSEVILGQSEPLLATSKALQTISILSIPTLSTLQELVDLLPEMTEAYEQAAAQESEIQELLQRSIVVMDDWYASIRNYNAACVRAAHEIQTAERQIIARLRLHGS